MAQVSGIEVRFSGNTQPLEQAVNRAEGALNSFSKTADNVVPGNFGNKIQNASYQIQDFATQVASGTSATRAFAQQAPQLLSGFGTVGVILGTVAAIAVPLAGTFLATGDAAAKLGSVLSTVGPYAATATAALAGFYAPALLGGIGATSSAIGVGLVGAIKAVTAAMMANPLGLLVAGVAAAAVAIFAFRDDIKQVFGIDFVGIIKGSVDWTIGTFVKASKVIGVVWSNLGSIVGDAVVSLANAAISSVLKLVQKGVDAINVLIAAANKIPGMNITPFGGFKPEDFTIPNQFADAAAKAGEEIGRVIGEKTGTGYVDAMVSTLGESFSKVQGALSGMFGSSADTATGKGKQGKDAQTSENPSQAPGTYFTDRLKAIQDSFATEMELKQQQYELDQQVLDNALQNKLISEQSYYDLSGKLAQQHQDSLSAIQQAGLQTNLQAASDFFGAAQQIAELGGKKTTKIAKMFGIAQALISTFQGAAKALTLPFPANLAAYATTLAQGMTAVAAIKGVNENGGGSSGAAGRGAARGGAGAGGGGGGGAAASAPTTTFAFTLVNDPMGFGEKFARQFIDQLNSTQRNGGQIRGVIA